MKSIASRIRRNIKHFGIARTVYMGFMNSINLFFYLTIIRILKNEVADPTFLETNEEFRWQFLDEGQMFELTQDPDIPLTESFVQAALEKGDECYAGFDGEAIACYGWYSNKPTERFGLTYHFRPDYMWQYAVFTHPKYRGRRLTASRGSRARREYLDRGFKGTLFSIDSHNFHSLRSVYASLDVQLIGSVVALRIGKHAWIHNSRRCREHGIYLAKPAAAAEPVPVA